MLNSYLPIVQGFSRKMDIDLTMDDEAAARHYKSRNQSKSTRNIYNNKVAKLFLWILYNRTSLVSTCFLDYCGTTTTTIEDEMDEYNAAVQAIKPPWDTKRLVKRATAWVNDLSKPPPLEWDDLSVGIFIQFICSIRRRDGTKVQHSVIDQCKAGLKKYMSVKGHRPDTIFIEDIDAATNGVIKETAQQIKEGIQPKIEQSVMPIQMTHYCTIASNLMVSPHSQDTFAHCFIVLQWNLMARSDNICFVGLRDFSVIEDSLAIVFAHSKTDQTGRKSKQPRRLFFNPYNVEICPINSLAIFLSCFPPTADQVMLFSGRSQYSRVSNILKSQINLLRSQDGSMNDGSYATHSLRKGAKSYCSSISITGVSDPVLMRGGWSQGAVQDAYGHQLEGGDAYVGRLLSGLRLDSYKFATLPPEIIDQDVQLLNTVIEQFPSFSQISLSASLFLFKALVYNSQWIIDNMHSTHPIFTTPLFMNQNLLSTLRHHCTVSLFKSTNLHATGIPEAAKALMELYKLSDRMKNSQDMIQEVPFKTLNLMKEFIQSEGLASNQVTHTGLESMMDKYMEKVETMISNNGNSTTNDMNDQEEIHDSDIDEELPFSWHFWGGKYKMLPHEYSIPSMTVGPVLYLFHNGCRRTGIPPLKRTSTRDFSNPNSAKRLGELRRVNRAIIGDECLSISLSTSQIHEYLNGFITT